MKKRILALFMSVFMVLSLLPMGIFADDSGAGTDSGVVFTKELLEATANAPAKIKLEAYVTGATTSSNTSLPTDIVLVLDQSGSMDEVIDNQTKLSIMSDAVKSFVDAVADMNDATGTLYRVAIVGFASESGYSNNTEILTAESETTVTGTEYQVVSGSLDTSKTYYIRDGQAYRAISYRTADFWSGIYSDGWYTTGRRPQAVNVSNTTVYMAVTTETVDKSTGVAFNNITAAHYASALVNCTETTIGATGMIGKAIAALDGNGATRTDLGIEMAAEIFAAQDYTGVNANRQRVVVLITDGVPTTQTNFSSTVANDAVAYAKEMKDDGAHIFSMYLGTPSTQSVNFLQAVSSNYPAAESITDLGDKAAETYYSAHTDPSAIQSMFSGIVNSITANSTLNEESIVTDTLSTYFELAANLDTTGTKQIEVYTVDKTQSGWADTEVPFANAKVEISGADNKTVAVTGFNFGAHCVTESPKGGAGSTDYGRKLVIYIPLAADDSADTFGGYLPTNEDAVIYQDADATEATVTADGVYYEAEIVYSLNGAARAHHIDTNDTYVVSYTAEYLNDILDDMITRLPNGSNNIGVNMTYTLYDAGKIDKDNTTSDDREDDKKIASITVNAGENTDVTDFDNWTLADASHTSDTITIDDDDNNFAEKVYVLACTLTSTNPSEPAKSTVYALLDIAVTNDDKTHIVYGTIDAGGIIDVDPEVTGEAVAGTIFNNTYTEAVKEGENSDIVTFTPKEGYEIKTITKRTLSDHAGNVVVDVIYDVNNTSGNTVTLTDGAFVFQAEDVTGGLEILVETSLKEFTLTTSDDDGSEIIDSTTYKYSTEKLNVPFQAIAGYTLNTLTVNGTPYDLTSASGREALENDPVYDAQFTTVTDAKGNTVVTGGYIYVLRTQNNTVDVTSVTRYYNVTLEYYLFDAVNNTYTKQDDMTEGPTAVKYGTKISDTEAPAYWPGDVKVFDGSNYTMSDWYRNYENNEFYGIVNLGAATMPAYDLVLSAVWTKNPDVKIADITIEKNVNKAHTEDSVFEFIALYHEHEAGTAAITIPANSAASVTETMSVILTDLQAQNFKNGNGYIYIYEIVGDDQDVWVYDNTRYELRWVGGAAALYRNGAPMNELKASFYNEIVDESVEISKTVSAGEAEVGDELLYTLTVENKGNVDIALTNIRVRDITSGSGTINYIDVAGDNVEYDTANGIFTVLSLAKGASETIQYTYIVDEADAGKTISNEIEVVSHHSDTPDSDDKTETKIKANVTYEYTGDVPAGSTAPVDSNSPYVAGATVTVLEHPAAVEGYTFDGWYNGNAKYNGDDTFTMPENNVTLEGKWSLNDYSITVNYYIEGTTTKLQESYVGEAKYGDSYDVANRIPAKIASGNDDYIWDSNDAATSGTVTDNVVINAYYTLDNWNDDKDETTGGDEIPDKYQVIFEYVSADTNMGTVAPEMEIITIEGQKETGTAVGKGSTATAKVGHTFNKWTNEDGATFEKTGEETGAVTLTTAEGGKTYVFTATWDENDYSITVNYYIEGTTTKLQESYVGEAKYGDSYDVANRIPAKIASGNDNYIWESNDAATSGTISDNVVINAYYTLDNWNDDDDEPTGGDDIPDKYQAYIIYKVEGGSWDGNDTADKEYVVTLKEKDAANGEWKNVVPAPVYGDYTPDVSSAEPDAAHTTPAYWSPIPHANEVIPAGEHVFTYIFTQDQEVSFTFDANGGSWAAAVAGYAMNADNTQAKMTVSFGGKVEEIAEVPTRDGYEFLGWYSKNNAGELSAKWWHAAGMTYDVYEDTTVYAKWEEVSVTPETGKEGNLYVNLQDENGTFLGGTTQPIKITDGAYEVSENTGADYVIPAVVVNNGNQYIYEGPTDYSAALRGTVEKDGENIVVILQYTLDNWNDDDDEITGGDGIPDKYQVIFEYVSDDTAKGTVAPEMEIITIAGMQTTGTAVGNGSVVTLKDGNVFDQWITESGAIFDQTNVNTGIITLNNAEGGRTYTFTATFETLYTVAYDLNGGTGAPGVDYSPVKVPGGTTVIVKEAPTRLFFIFAGYKYNNRTYEPGDKIVVNENVTLVAQWVPFPIIPDNEGTAELTKVDAKDPSITLSGVVFQLYNVRGNRLIGTYTTDVNGEIVVRRLPAGDYYWIEKQPAEGYHLDNSKHEFTINAGRITSMIVDNERTEVPSVFTGDHFAYIIGYEDGTVQPEGNITRAEVATIFFRLLDGATRDRYMTKSNSFSDVEDGMWFNTAVSTMAAMGVVKGYPDGTFKPDEYITRAEFTAIAARFDTNGNTTGASFIDIYDHWAKREIDIAINNGWVLGYEDGTFRPDQYITRAESMALVNRVLQRIPESVEDLLDDMNIWPDNMDTDKWYYLTVQEATNSHYYERKVSGYEYWIARKEDPDWTIYEN